MSPDAGVLGASGASGETKGTEGTEGTVAIRRRLVGLGAGVAAAVAVGYVVFLVFATDVMTSPAAWGLPLFAVVAAVATFFSPCSFPLLPGFVAYTVERMDGDPDAQRRPALAAAGGVLAFTLLLGAAVGVAGAAAGRTLSISGGDPSPVTLALRAGVGALLVGLGALPLLGVTLRTGLLSRRSGTVVLGEDRRSLKDLFVYGFGYNAAALGCAGPILAGLVVFALAVGDAGAAVAAFVLYSAAMAGLMYGVTRAVRRHGEGALSHLADASPRIKRIGGAVQVAIGAFVLLTVLAPAWFVGTFFPG